MADTHRDAGHAKNFKTSPRVYNIRSHIPTATNFWLIQLDMDDSNRARTRQCLAVETPEQREARLSTQRARRRQRLASDIPEQREPRLVVERAHRRRRLASETAEQRETRLS